MNEETTTSDETPETESASEKRPRLGRRARRAIERKQQRFERLDTLSYYGAWFITAAAGLITLLYLIPMFIGMSSHVVLTESMSGSIERGDVVITRPFEPQGDRLDEGDVALITSGGTRYLHRVVEVNEDGTYTTRGDANNTSDFFKPRNEDIEAERVSVVRQPVAGIITLFAFNGDWFTEFGAAIQNGDWPLAKSILPLAPWGWLTISTLLVLFWVVIPAALARAVNRANRDAALDFERLKEDVATHEESIASHGESIGELEPVVEELKADHDTAKAEKAAEFEQQVATQGAFWEAVAEFDPESMYDPDPFGAPVEPAEEEPSESVFELRPSRNPFELLRERQEAEKASQDALARDLSGSLAQNASTSTLPARTQRHANSAFYFGEDD